MKTVFAGTLAFLVCTLACSQPVNSSAQNRKQLYLPAKVWMVPDSNDYSLDTSRYNFSRMSESENIAVFWHKEFGSDPASNPDSTKRFKLKEVVSECERFYDFYVNKLKFVDKGNSVTDRKKVLLYVIGGDEHTAFGGGEEDIGILWTPPVRMNKAPYGALAHELGHSFQYLVNADGAWGFTSSPEGSHGQSIFEMTSQYMLWQVYPEWMTFENYHLVSFMKKTHYAFLHETNMYHTPYVLEYWSNKHGIEFIGKLWRNAKKGEDPVLAYQRLTGIDQTTFNEEMFDAVRRFITWDLPRIEKVAAPYANQHTTALRNLRKGWYQITPDRCPQNYGYNGIKLNVPSAGTNVKLEFESALGEDGFRSVQPENAGWRYGFIAVKEDGTRVYGNVGSARKGKLEFVIPDKTQHLWLVVCGAPLVHTIHLIDGKDENDEQWPYRIRLKGTTLHPSAIAE